MRLILVLLMLLPISACALNSRPPRSSLIATKNSPVVYIHPMENIYQEASVGILPFQVPDNISAEQGVRVASLFKDVMLGKRTFKSVQQLQTPYGDLDDAVRVGKEAGVDLVLAGRINYALAGSELGGARVDAAVRLLNTQSGNTVWYVEQVMDQAVDYPDLSWRGRLDEAFSMHPVRAAVQVPAVPNMLMRIAMDMSDVMAGAKYVDR